MSVLRAVCVSERGSLGLCLGPCERVSPVDTCVRSIGSSRDLQEHSRVYVCVRAHACICEHMCPRSIVYFYLINAFLVLSTCQTLSQALYSISFIFPTTL